MKSRITIDFRGLDATETAGQFEPVIRMNVAASDDVRDKLCKGLIESIGYDTNLLFIQNVTPPSANHDVEKNYLIAPIPEESRKTVLHREISQLLGKDDDIQKKIDELFGVERNRLIEDDPSVREVVKVTPLKEDKLRKDLFIPASVKAHVNDPGYQKTFLRHSVSVLIGIGKDHSAELVMDADAWEALKAGEVISF